MSKTHHKIARVSNGEHACRMQDRRAEYAERIAGFDRLYPAAQDAMTARQLNRHFRRRVASPGFRKLLRASIAAAIPA